MPPVSQKSALMPHTFACLPGSTTYLAASPGNRDLQRGRALAHLEALTGELAQRPALPDDDSPFTQAIQKGITDIDHLRQLASNPTHPEAILTVAIRARHQALETALRAHHTGLADFFIFDSGRVALDDGTIGVITAHEGAIFFTPHSGLKPITAFSNDATPKHILDGFLDRTPSGRIIHCGKTYFFNKNAPKDKPILVDENGRGFCVLEQSGKLTLQADHTGFITKAEGFNRVLAAGASFYYLGENGLHPATRLTASNDPLFFARTPEGPVLINSEGVTPTDPKLHFLTPDEKILVNNTLFSTTTEPDILKSPGGDRYVLVSWPDGTFETLLIKKDSTCHITPLDEFGGKLIRFTDSVGKQEHCLPWSDCHGPHSAIWPKAMQQNWDFLTPSGNLISAQSLLMGSYGKTGYTIEISLDQFKLPFLPVLIPVDSNKWHIALIDSKILFDLLGNESGHVALDGVIFGFSQNPDGNVNLYPVPPKSLKSRRVIPVIDFVDPDLSKTSDFFHFEASGQAESRPLSEHPDLGSLLEWHDLELKGLQWLPTKTIRALGQTWTINKSFKQDGCDFHIVSRHDQSGQCGKMIRLLKVDGRRRVSLVKRGEFHFSITGFARQTFELYVQNERVWDVSRIDDRHVPLACLGAQERMHPENYMIFHRVQNRVQVLSLKQTRSWLEQHTQSPPLREPEKPWVNKIPQYEINLGKPKPRQIGSLVINDRVWTKPFNMIPLHLRHSQGFWEYHLPDPADPHVIQARQNGLFIPQPDDILVFHEWMENHIPAHTLAKLKVTWFYPGPTIRGEQATFNFQTQCMSIYPLSAKSREDWLSGLMSMNILQHELNGHARQRDDPLYVYRVQAGMILDGATMIYGKNNWKEYDAVLAEYLGMRIYGQTLTASLSVFWAQMERDRLAHLSQSR